MRLRESLRFAWRGILANRMRSTLTMSGIVIGIASVITLVAVGTGSSRDVQTAINRLGSTTLYVFSTVNGANGPDAIKVRKALGIPPPPPDATKTRAALLTLEDAAALQDRTVAPSIGVVVPTSVVFDSLATFGGRRHVIPSFSGTTRSITEVDGTAVTEGRLFTEVEFAEGRRVVLLGRTIANALSPNAPAALLGQSVRIGPSTFLVIGLLQEKGKSGPIDLDNRAWAPRTAVADSTYGYGSAVAGPINAIALAATSPKTTEQAQIEIHRILNHRHGVSPTNPDFIVSSPSAVLAAAEETDRTLSVMLAAVAGISLLVGGIGVMNIMLVSVTERTREIGVRKSLGADERDIVAQFLGEAMILSMFGGIVGVGVGYLACQFSIAGVQPVIAPYSVYLAIGVSLLTGLFFGLYPARRAARMRPIDALRYD